MKPDRLLYLSAHQLAAFHWQAGKLTSEGVFPTNEDGHHAFAAYLGRHAQSIYALLANVAEEGFQVDTIPFLRGKDRQAVISRKLAQLFFNAPLTAAHSLGFKKSQRKDERILFAALTNNELLAPWLAAVRGAGVALVGLYSLPLQTPALLRRLKIAEPHCLLLSVQDQSLRQSYFENGELLFSRLTPLNQSSIGGIAQAFAAEAVKLQQYLTSQRSIGRGQAITAHILVHPSVQKIVESSCIDTPTLHFNFLNIVDCARLTGLKTLPSEMQASGRGRAQDNSHADALFLNLVATTPPRVQFANDEQRHGYHLRLLRFSLHSVGALVLAGCLLFAAEQMVERFTVRQQTATLASEAADARRRYDDIVRTFPPIPTNSETLMQVINRYKELEKSSASPTDLFVVISRALTSATPVEIDRIAWQDGAAADNGANATAPSAFKPLGEGEGEAALVEGSLTLADNTGARQVLATFDSFVAALKASPQVQVDVVERPVDIDSGKSLRGGDLNTADNRPRRFSLQITRKPAS